MKSRCLRLSSELDLDRIKADRRERFQKGKIAVPERDILAAGLELLQRHPVVAFAHRVNTRSGFVLGHGVYDRLLAAGHIRKGEAQFMRFSFKGASDISGMLRGGRLLAIECKADRGVVSDDQTAYLEAVNGGGGIGFVARSVDEILRGLSTEGGM